MDSKAFYESYKASSLDGTIQTLLKMAWMLGKSYSGAIRMSTAISLNPSKLERITIGHHTFFTLRKAAHTDREWYHSHLVDIEDVVKAVFPHLAAYKLIGGNIGEPRFHSSAIWYSHGVDQECLRSTWHLPVGGRLPNQLDYRPLFIPIGKVPKNFRTAVANLYFE